MKNKLYDRNLMRTLGQLCRRATLLTFAMLLSSISSAEETAITLVLKPPPALTLEARFDATITSVPAVGDIALADAGEAGPGTILIGFDDRSTDSEIDKLKTEFDQINHALYVQHFYSQVDDDDSPPWDPATSNVTPTLRDRLIQLSNSHCRKSWNPREADNSVTRVVDLIGQLETNGLAAQLDSSLLSELSFASIESTDKPYAFKNVLGLFSDACKATLKGSMIPNVEKTSGGLPKVKTHPQRGTGIAVNSNSLLRDPSTPEDERARPIEIPRIYTDDVDPLLPMKAYWDLTAELDLLTRQDQVFLLTSNLGDAAAVSAELEAINGQIIKQRSYWEDLDAFHEQLRGTARTYSLMDPPPRRRAFRDEVPGECERESMQICNSRVQDLQLEYNAAYTKDRKSWVTREYTRLLGIAEELEIEPEIARTRLASGYTRLVSDIRYSRARERSDERVDSFYDQYREYRWATDLVRFQLKSNIPIEEFHNSAPLPNMIDGALDYRIRLFQFDVPINLSGGTASWLDSENNYLSLFQKSELLRAASASRSVRLDPPDEFYGYVSDLRTVQLAAEELSLSQADVAATLRQTRASLLEAYSQLEAAYATGPVTSPVNSKVVSVLSTAPSQVTPGDALLSVSPLNHFSSLSCLDLEHPPQEGMMLRLILTEYSLSPLIKRAIDQYPEIGSELIEEIIQSYPFLAQIDSSADYHDNCDGPLWRLQIQPANNRPFIVVPVSEQESQQTRSFMTQLTWRYLEYPGSIVVFLDGELLDTSDPVTFEVD